MTNIAATPRPRRGYFSGESRRRREYSAVARLRYTISDTSYALRDLLFAPPYHHPSYAVVDGSGEVRSKFVGPCCGVERWNDCSPAHLRSLNATLTNALAPLLAEQVLVDVAEEPEEHRCTPRSVWTPWSNCTAPCGDAGLRYRSWSDGCGATDRETAPCEDNPLCEEDACWSRLGGAEALVEVVAEGFAGARDVAFSPRPGVHLGSFAEGRSFPTDGLEAWVVNAHNHSVSIVVGVGTNATTTLSRRDRGFFHYMANATALLRAGGSRGDAAAKGSRRGGSRGDAAARGSRRDDSLRSSAGRDRPRTRRESKP